MLEYVIKSGLCLIVLYSFYKLFMEGEHFHKIKRIYLLLSLAIALILPLITITYEVEVPLSNTSENSVFIESAGTSVHSEESLWNKLLPVTLISIYSIGFLIFAFRFFKNLRELLVEVRKNDQLKDLNYIYVLLGRKLDPHTFFNYIFLNKKEYQEDKISSAVIEHEKAHVDQRHSIDLLLIEFIQVIFWFNPVFLLIRRSIKLNHEFLADQSVLNKNFNPADYSNILINYSSGHHHNTFSSPINHSLIKKRIIMITKSFSLRRLVLRALIFLPVLAGCVYLFNEDIIAKPVPGEINMASTIPVLVQEKKNTIHVKVVEEDIWLNRKQVEFEDFSEAINNLTQDWSQEEMQNPWFEVDIKNSEAEFIEKLNKEYRKTKLSQVSGTEFIAPKPPAPVAGTPPPPPPPVKKRNDNVPPPPPVPAPPHKDHDKLIKEELERAEKMEIHYRKNSAHLEADRKRMKEERRKLQSKREELREIEKELEKNQNLSEAQKERLLRDQAREKERLEEIAFRMEQKQQEIEKRHADMEKRQMEIERRHENMPPPPPPPAKVDYPEDATYYLNDREVSREKALKVIEKGKTLQVDIKQTKDGNDVVRIYT